MLLDIDDFKFINDCFGHQAGDSVLEAIGRILMETTGRANFVGRYGGDEFLVFLPDTLPGSAAALAEHIRIAVAAKTFIFDEEIVTLTVSLGIATSITSRETCNDLIACADRALYKAKLAGRNKALHAEDLTVKQSVVKAKAPSLDLWMRSENGPS